MRRKTAFLPSHAQFAKMLIGTQRVAVKVNACEQRSINMSRRIQVFSVRVREEILKMQTTICSSYHGPVRDNISVSLSFTLFWACGTDKT